MPKYWLNDRGEYCYSHDMLYPGIIGRGRNRREAFMNFWRLVGISNRQSPEN